MVNNKISAIITTITPEIAEELLKSNTNNYRAIDKRKVEQYAREMEKGLWEANYEAIQIDENGILKNGQHRLLAIARSGKPQEMLVVRGVKQQVSVYDVGKTRSLAETAHAKNIDANSSALSAAAVVMNPEGHYGKNEVLDYYSSHSPETFETAYLISRRGSNKPVLRKAGIIAAIYCALKMDVCSEEALYTFATIANSSVPDENLPSFAPLMLRKTLQEGLKNEHGFIAFGSALRIPQFEVTWQAILGFVKQRKPKRTYKPDGSSEKILQYVRLM